MWQQGASDIAKNFYQDEVEIYCNNILVNDIGEGVEHPVVTAVISCNLQEAEGSTTNHTVSGVSAPQALRITTRPTITLDHEKTYKVKIVKARIPHTAELYAVTGWRQGMLGLAIYISRETNV